MVAIFQMCIKDGEISQFFFNLYIKKTSHTYGNLSNKNVKPELIEKQVIYMEPLIFLPE